MIDYIVLSLHEAIDSFGEELVAPSLRAFTCQEDTDLEEFLSEKALSYERAHKGKTFLLVDREKLVSNRQLIIIAYYTLATTAIDLADKSDNKKKKIVGDYPNRTKLNCFPAYLIGQLGRCDKYTHEDLAGDIILNEAFSSLSRAAAVVGGKLVILECREHMYDKVYHPLGFHKLSENLNENNLYMLYRRVDLIQTEQEH